MRQHLQICAPVEVGPLKHVAHIYFCLLTLTKSPKIVPGSSRKKESTINIQTCGWRKNYQHISQWLEAQIKADVGLQ